MKKIAIVGLHNLHLMQFLYKYTEALDAENIEYDVLYWDRDMDTSIKYRRFNGNKIPFSYKMSNYQSKYKKIIGFIMCIIFMVKTIKKNGYDHIILLTTQTALPLYVFSWNVRKSTFVYDYRDITYENNPLCKLIIKHIIHKSAFTAISSEGFKEVLGDNGHFVMAHNECNITLKNIRKEVSDKIRIVYWGMIRQVEFNKKVCDYFGKNDCIELYYHGEGANRELQEYCIAQGYHSVKFSGRYMQSDIESFASKTDVLLNLYDNDKQQKLATTVKLYDGIRYGLPMVISDYSHMAEMMKGNKAVYLLDLKRDAVDSFISWYRELQNVDIYWYEKELKDIQKDDEEFRKQLIQFCRDK